MKNTIAPLAQIALVALLATTHASAVETPTLPNGRTPTVVVFEKKGGTVEITDVMPASGSVGVTTSEGEVTRTVELLQTLGVKPVVTKVKATTITTYTISDVNCTEIGTTRCEANSRKLHIGKDTISDLITLLSDYRGTRADFEQYAEFGMEEISCKITEVGEINATYRQCNFTY